MGSKGRINAAFYRENFFKHIIKDAEKVQFTFSSELLILYTILFNMVIENSID